MSKVRVSSFAVSLDGYSAGPRQSLENPLGVRGPELFEWFFSTLTWKQMHGQEGGSTDVDDEWARRGMENVHRPEHVASENPDAPYLAQIGRLKSYLKTGRILNILVRLRL